MKTINFSFLYFLYFTISTCFSIWLKNILYSITKCLRCKKKERQSTTTNLLRMLLWMCFKHNDLDYPEEMHKLHPCTCTKRDKGWNFRGFVYKVSLKKFCEALKIKLLWHCIGSRFWKTYLKKLAAKSYFSVKMHSAISNNIKVARHHWCFLNYILFIENSELWGSVIA